jgi:aminopeptidase
MCKGDRNIPDGEVFSCPAKNSVNGRINSTRRRFIPGQSSTISAGFKDGRIVNASANNLKA